MSAKKFIFDKPNVLVLGGAGFIGSHLCDELVATCKVICVDNFSSGSEANIDHLLANSNFKFIKHDMSQPVKLADYPELKDFEIEFQGLQQIYNLACPTSPKLFEKNRIANLLANSYVVKNALDLALEFEAKLLHFSSSVVYGSREDNLVKVAEEDMGFADQLSARSSYNEGKRFAETLVKNYRDVYQLDAIILRLFRVYGPHMPLNQGHMIPDFISQALDNKDLMIYGNQDFASSFCYVHDAIQAVVKMMTSTESGPLNIGSDIDLKLSDIAKQVINLTGSKSQIVYQDPMLFMTSLKLPDISRARELLSWIPLTSIEDGLTKTIENLRANEGLKSMDYNEFKS